MKNRALDAVGADAKRCACDRPLAHHVLDESIPTCLKCGREMEDARATQGLLTRAVGVAVAAVRSADARRPGAVLEP